MASLMKAVHLSRSVNNVTKLLANISLAPNISPVASPVFIPRATRMRCALIHTTSYQNSLMEFFDDESNWGKNEVKVGRSWKQDELRLKSNEDLHKLWYVLLKERNMLLTMEEACKRACEVFPNPERLDKVEESMSNIESVVRERNRAYHMLETGENGERPSRITANALGIRFLYKHRQYSIPQFMNSNWYKRHMLGYGGYAVRKFLRLYHEKLNNAKYSKKKSQKTRVTALMRRFPNLDLEAVKEQYPDLDIESIRAHRKSHGHYIQE